MTEEHFDSEFAINAKGLIFTTRKALPPFGDGGSINLSASIVSIRAMAAFNVVSATSAAVRSFDRTRTVDRRVRRSRINALSHGPIETPSVVGLSESRDEIDPMETRPRRRRPPGPDGRGRRD